MENHAILHRTYNDSRSFYDEFKIIPFTQAELKKLKKHYPELMQDIDIEPTSKNTARSEQGSLAVTCQKCHE